MQHGFSCSKRKPGYKSEATPASSRPTVMLDVVYAKEPTDPGFVSTKETFDGLERGDRQRGRGPEPRPSPSRRRAQVAGQG